MTPAAIKRLFETAARHGARFRAECGDWPQRPKRDYQQSLAAFDGALPEGPQAADDVIGDLVAAAEPGLQMATRVPGSSAGSSGARTRWGSRPIS